MLVGKPGFQRAILKLMGNSGIGTPGFQQATIKFMGNVCRHTRISADHENIHEKCW